MPHSTEERIAELDKKIEQIKAQKKALKSRAREAERKARNHRLIEIGAEVEKALGYSLDTIEMRKALGDFLRVQEARGKWVTIAIDKARAASIKEEND